jgi:hypothetical protein
MIAGCGPTFDPASLLTGLRVLAIKAEPPEVAPGETSLLTPLIVDSRGMDAGTPRATWSLCLQAPLPGAAVGDECLSTDLGASNVVTKLGEGPTMQVTMPNVTQAQLGVPDSTGGVYLPVIMRVTDGVETVTTVYRLRYTAKISTPFFTGPIQPPNHNPKIDDILVSYGDDGGIAHLDEIKIHQKDRIAMRASLSADSAEMYPRIEGTLQLPDGGISLDGGIKFFDGGIDIGPIHLVEVTETLRVSWFTNIGRFVPDVTGASGKLDAELRLDKYLPPDPYAPADIDIYIVVRDDRGGTDFTTRKLLLR